MPLDYLRHVPKRYVGVPNILGKYENDRPFLMTARAGIA